MAPFCPSFYEVVAGLARQAGDALAAIDGIAGSEHARVPKRLTYLQLHAEAERLAGALAWRLREGVGDAGVAGELVLATKMRRGNEWYCIFCAAAKLRVPLVALSTDLPDKAAEDTRNAEILVQHRPALLILDGGRGVTAQDVSAQPLRTVTFEELWKEAATATVPTKWNRSEPVLCYAYTGGTTEASRCVQITHEMACHEVKVYPYVASLGRSDMIMQQHSVYWAASAYGEIDIALAYGCALVFCEAWDIEGVVVAIKEHRVTCAGLVPSILAALRHEDLPSLRLVLTWGEALQVRTAREWAKHVHLVDLLISTEYWLSLYADWTAHCQRGGTDRPVFRTLPDVQVRIRERCDEPGTGELLVAGPMVSAGYTDPKRNLDTFVVEGGVRWYCTKDNVELRDSGVLFRGRADDLIKVGAKWFDVKELERKLQALDGVAEAHVLGRDVFAALGLYREGVVPALRQQLPPDFSLRLLPSLPRKPGTDKVDRKRLAALVMPIKGAAQGGFEEEKLARELASLKRWYSPLVLVVVAALLHATMDVVAQASSDPPQLLPAVLPVGFVLKAVWEFIWRSLCLSYLVLLSHYWRRLPRQCQNFPLGYIGLLVFVASAAPTPMWGLLSASPGIWKSWTRRRLLSWPVVCGLGFPLWARESGQWWPRQGVTGTIKWYWQIAVDGAKMRFQEGRQWTWGLVKPVLKAADDVVYQVRRLLRLSQQCKNCGKRGPPRCGRLMPEVDPFWYCNDCWMHYERHHQCGRCNEWRVRGKPDALLGLWVCSGCERLLPKERKPVPPAEDTDRATPADDGSGSSMDGETLRSDRTLMSELLPNRAEGSSQGGPDGPTMAGSEREPDSLAGAAEWQWRKQANGGWKKFLVQTHLICLVDVAPSLVRATGSAEVQTAVADRSGHPAPQAPAVHKSATWRMLERSTGLVFSSLDEPTVRLDSLRKTKLASAVRREVGKFVTRSVWNRCKTIGELLDAIDHLAPEPPPTTSAEQCCCLRRTRTEEHAVWGLMWRNRCQWTLRRNGALSEATLREVLADLAARHPALRTELADPMCIFTAVQQALSVFTLWSNQWRACAPSSSSAASSPTTASRIRSRVVDAAKHLTHWSFRHAWGRVRAIAPGRGVKWLTVLERAASEEEAHKKLWKNMPGFEPPVQVVLAQFGEGNAEGAVVHITVTHMLSDGYSIVPLLMDLAQLVARLEAPNPELIHVPPPVPNALAALEDRLFRSISGGDTLSDGITQEQILPTKAQRHPSTLLVTLHTEVVAALRQAALHLAVTDEILMLTVLGAALGHLQQEARVSFLMVAPQRDGRGESEMVGLFADIRLLTIDPEGLSYAGLALELHHLVKERRWGSPSILVQGEIPFVNFEWTELESHHGFSQMPFSRSGAELSLQNPLKVAVDQGDSGTWRMRTAFDKDIYGEDDRERFFNSFMRGLRSLLEDPLELVWQPTEVTASTVAVDQTTAVA